MKRFWTTATAEPLADGFEIRLDGKPMRLPGGSPLRIEAAPLARAIAAEWQQAGGAPDRELSLDDVPLTRLAGTAQDRIAPDPQATVTALARYAETDLLCYRAEDPRLAERQARDWQPWLDWAALHHDAPLRVTAGVMPIAQPPDSLAALRRSLATLPPIELAALGVAVPALGSLVLGLALRAGRLTAAEAHRLATLDEAYQSEQWGEDASAAAQRAKRAADVADAARLLALSAG